MHTRAIPKPPPAPAPALYFVVMRANGDWTPAAKILAVYPSELLAEDRAAKEKLERPQQHFGVMALRSEARTVINPVEIVHVQQASA